MKIDPSDLSGARYKSSKDPMHWELKGSVALIPKEGRVLMRPTVSFPEWYALNM